MFYIYIFNEELDTVSTFVENNSLNELFTDQLSQS